MKKTLFIAEKPSVAMTIAQALGINGERQNGYIESDDKIITWCVGHLVRLSYPEKYDEDLAKWELETLPFIPGKEEFLYEPGESVIEQFEVVRKLYRRDDIDKLYIYPDDGQEGYYLQALVLMQAPIRTGIPVYCCICDSQTDNEIRRAFNNAEPWSSERITRIIKAGYMRAKEDYLIGINYSRVLTLQYEELLKEYIGYQKGTIAVGRVMSCVLGMVVKREREIADFVPQTFYKIIANYNDGLEAAWKDTDDSSIHGSPSVYDGKGIRNKEEAESFISSLVPEVIVTEVSVKTEKKNPPLLFSLTELQAECANKYKYTPQKTLDIAQFLYEKKLTTYPRTDSRYLPVSLALEIENIIEGIRDGYEDQADLAKDILHRGAHRGFEKTKYVDDSKIEDHYAIIPTGKGYENLESLTPEQATVYDLIVRRFLCLFFPPAEYEKAEAEVVAEREHFHMSKKVLLSPGYLDIIGYEKPKEDPTEQIEKIRKMKKGSAFAATYSLQEQETTPPKRYSSSSLLLAMDNAGQFVEEEELREVLKDTKGIGTTATRAGILEKLVHTNHFLDLNEKTLIYKPTYKGELVYDILDETIPTILNPRFSASWTFGLKQIEKGQITDDAYFDKLTGAVRTNVDKIKANHLDENLKKDFENVKMRYGKEAAAAMQKYDCPLCKSTVRPVKNGFMCINYGKEEGKCSFFIGNSICGKKLSPNQIGKLIKDKRLDIIKGFKKKDGTEFSAPLYMSSDGKVSFSPPEGSISCDIKCPICRKPLKENSYSWDCECGFKVSRTIAGKNISRTNLEKIVSGEGTDLISGFTGKNGNFDARLVLKEGKVTFVYRQGQISGISCPVCGKAMEYTPFGMACSSYKKGCSFALSNKISGKMLSDKVLIKLISERETDEIKGFEKKDGSKFSAALHLEGDGKVKFGALPKKTSIICPKCRGSSMISLGKYVQCPKCSAKAPLEFYGRTMSADDITNLLVYGRTGKIAGFKNKEGKKFSAIVIKTKDGYNFEFNNKVKR